MLFFKRSFGPKIQLLAQRSSSDGYGGSAKKYRKISDVRKYINNYVFNPVDGPYLSISCSLHGKIIPMLDIDSEGDLAITTLWLKENDIKYAMVMSGSDSYWLFLDMLTSNRRAVKTIWLAPGVDDKYKEFVKKGKISVRGFHRADKNYFEPEILSSNTNNKIIHSFCDQLLEHYQLEMLKWLYRYEMYMNGDVDVADPRTGTIGKMLLGDVLK